MTEDMLKQHILVPEGLSDGEADAYKDTVWNEMGGLNGLAITATIEDGLFAEELAEFDEELALSDELDAAINHEEIIETLGEIAGLEDALSEVSSVVESQIDEIGETIEEGVLAVEVSEEIVALEEATTCISEC